MPGPENHLTFAQMWICRDFFDRRDRGARHVRLLQAFKPIRSLIGREMARQDWLQFGVIGGAIGVGGEARVGLELAHPDRVAEALPNGLVATAGNKMAVGGAEVLEG